ncbi:uncharacterized protein [Anabrus simplex]|uniref:uncharacterized protein n=1 Tax=Anabrus simplex TaxID=316456 RepID=UPI0035A3282B
MDQELEIRQEPVWLEGTAKSSLESFEFLSEIMPLKQEIKLEIREPVPTPENAFEENVELASEMILLKQETRSELTEPRITQPSADTKNKIFIEQLKVDQLTPYVKEENKHIDISESKGLYCCNV